MTIVYFDGYCNLCNAFIDFLIRHDQHRRLKFASLQGRTASERLPQSLRDDLSTVVLEQAEGFQTESTAALSTIAILGGGWQWVRVLMWIPRWLRDPVYRWIAKHRVQFAGRRATCRLPNEHERVQFLD